MGRKSKLSLSWFLIILSLNVVIPTIGITGHKMSELLSHQIHLQISLTIPEYSYDAYALHGSTALAQAIEFLTEEQTPFRLLFNQTNAKPAPNISPLARHLKNQAVCLVFVVIEDESEVVSIAETLFACAGDGSVRKVAAL